MLRFWDKPFSHRVPVKGFMRLDIHKMESNPPLICLSFLKRFTALLPWLSGEVQSCGHRMRLAMVSERALWLSLLGLSERETVEFLDAPVERKPFLDWGTETPNRLSYSTGTFANERVSALDSSASFDTKTPLQPQSDSINTLHAHHLYGEWTLHLQEVSQLWETFSRSAIDLWVGMKTLTAVYSSFWQETVHLWVWML